MARKKREKSVSGIYHVMLRGINKQNIFFCEDDYVKMMYILHDCQYKILGRYVNKKVISSNLCTILAYCILDNHLHILIREGEEKISDIVKRIEVKYAAYYNTKYERVGHLFQGRYASEPVNDMLYLHRLLRYIHRNSVKAMEARTPEEYPYSSWNEYVKHKSNIIKVLKPTAIEAILDEWNLFELTQWVNDDVDDRCMDMDSFGNVISDHDAFEILAEVSGINNPEDFRLLDSATQIHFLIEAVDNGISLRQAARLGTITDYQMQKAYKNKKDWRKVTISISGNGIELIQDRIRKMEGLGKTTRLRMHQIIEYLAKNPNAKRTEIAEHLNLNSEVTRRLLVRLMNEDIITQNGASKSSTYIIKM